MGRNSGEKRVGHKKINNMSPKQRKTTAILMQFFVFFIAAAAGLTSANFSVITAIILLFAVIVLLRLLAVCRYISEIDKSNAWIRATVVAFAISGLMILGYMNENLMMGIFGFGFVGLIFTVVQFLVWKIASFFVEHTNPLPSSDSSKGHQNYDIKDLSKESRVYITQFDQLYSEIPSLKKPPISRQTKHIREVYMQVHGVLTKNPELAPMANELMDYHFPQALKLLETYRDFTKKKVKVDNVGQILSDTVQSFDTLSSAVNMRLNSLYAGIVLDVKTDMAVMENITNKDKK